MLYFLFMILMFYIFGKLFFFGLKAAWGLSKFVLTIILLPISLMVMVSCGLLYFAFVLLIVVGIMSFFKTNTKNLKVFYKVSYFLKELNYMP